MSEILATKRTDIMMVDPRNIVVRDGFNVRSDMGDLEGLRDSIIETGLQVPLKAKKVRDTEQWELVDGHRRYKAVQMAIEDGYDIKYIQVMPFKGNEEDQLFAMVVTGTGQKPLTDIEQAEAVKRLVNFNYKADEIARKIGKSVQHIYNLIALAGVPKAVKDKVVAGEITGGTVVQIAREAKDGDDLTKTVDEAVKAAKESGKTKATAKNVATLTKKQPMQKLKEAYALLEKEEVSNEKVELLAQILIGAKDSSVEELANLFR